jgi:hypothetical protein
MSISTINVVVPSSGDGPIANISSLVGDKTFELTGLFEGRYLLLGSHNGVNFTPILEFESNGEESIKTTLDLALSHVRLNANASSPVGVTLNVTGVTTAGTNHFTTLGTLAPGATGLQPIIDLNTVFPPTGVEEDITLICIGGFAGLLTIRGSMDGAHFTPMASFRADPQMPSLLGSNQILYFSPSKTKDLIRYLQLDLNGVVSSTTVVTYGGANPATGGGGSGETVISVSDEESKLADDTEVILYQWPINLSLIPIAQVVSVQFNANIQTIGADPTGATFRVYVGSTTPGNTAGGTLRAVLNTVSGSQEQASYTGAGFANPGGICQIQVTGQSAGALFQAAIYGVSITIS